MDVYDKIISNSKQVVAEQLRIIAEAKKIIADNSRLVEEATIKLNDAKNIIDKHNHEEMTIKNGKQIVIDRKINTAKYVLTKDYAIGYLRKNYIEPKYLCVTKYRLCECLIGSRGDCKCSVYNDKITISKDKFYEYLASPDTQFNKDVHMDGTVIKCKFRHHSSDHRVKTFLEFEFAVKIDDLLNQA